MNKVLVKGVNSFFKDLCIILELRVFFFLNKVNIVLMKGVDSGLKIDSLVLNG